MNSRISYIIEIIWLVIAITCLVIGTHKTLASGIKYSLIFFILSFIAFLMYSIRRYIRKSSKK